ncbi:alpha-ribazole phosphatase [Ruminococcus sp. YE71]|uniref:histidine phosphatase family protein n=1 Tax=unclassified Ruminococcus TaxID=2608920 RepID=UPI0008843497|nr:MULTISPECIES: histidine phosphatase family protein [unclassified Ruminococcus]SDA10054.1 alpha-ribazole phosphatase [Ruminococcus sp. YE78]SFW11135.1 alpha-ribazole phosphatase [Ruminococcus sp. YE71]
MKGYRITFIRHGATQGNVDGKYIGVTDLPLSAEGAAVLYEKVEEAGYPSFQKVYLSPLKRCLQTAYIMAQNAPMVEIPELVEMDFGDFEEKTPAELKDLPEYKKFLQGGLDNPPPNGESARQVVTRCFKAMAKIIEDMMEEGLTNVAVVTHSGIIMNLMACFGLPKRSPMEYACDFGEGFEVLVTAQLWQRSGAFEIIGSWPPVYEEQRGEYFIDRENEEND